MKSRGQSKLENSMQQLKGKSIMLPVLLVSIKRAVRFENELHKYAMDSKFLSMPPALFVCFFYKCKQYISK